jgi:CRISPR/Cas system-associated protein Cas10 (large subunit of type III CRISPR-Cas system)
MLGDIILFLKRIQKWIGIAFLTSAVLFVFTPNKKEMLMIYGGGTIIDYIQNNKELQKIPDNVVKALNKWLEEELDEND